MVFPGGSESLSDVTSAGEDREKRGTPSAPTGISDVRAAVTSVASGNNPAGLDIRQMIAESQRKLGSTGEQQREGFQLNLTREVLGPTYGPTFEGFPDGGNLGLGEGGTAGYGMTSEGAILTDAVNFNDLMRGGITEFSVGVPQQSGDRQFNYLSPGRERIIDLVTTAAEGDIDLFDPIFKAAATTAALRQAGGDSRANMEDVLQDWVKGGLPDGIKRKGSGGGGGPFRNVTRQVNLTNEGTARRLINDTLSRELGRVASKQETAAFLKALNFQEKENPLVQVSEGVRSAGGTDQDMTISGGFDATDFAGRFARAQEGYAEYQAATTYMDAFIDALESDSRVI